MITTEFERVPDAEGYYISSNAPSSGEFVKVDEYKKLEIEIGRLNCVISELRGQLVNDTCMMCNWLERGDCHDMKQKLRDQLEWLWGNCKIIYFPPHPAYPLEHAPAANKDSREFIETEMKKILDT